MKHIKRLLPFLVLVFIVSSCGDSTSKDPVEASIHLLNETDDLADANSDVKQEAIQKLNERRGQNEEIIGRIKDALKEETNPSNKKTLTFRRDRLGELNSQLNKRIFNLEGRKVNRSLEEVAKEPETDTLTVSDTEIVTNDSVIVEEPDSIQSELLSENDSLSTQETDQVAAEAEDSTSVAEVSKPEPAEESEEESSSAAESSDEVDRSKLLNDVVPEGVMWFWIKVAGIIIGLVVLVLLGMHFIPKIMNKIQSGGFSWPSFSLGGVGTFFSGIFSGFSGVANRRKRRILLGSLLGLLLLIGIGLALYQYGDSAVTAVTEMITSDSDERKVADHRDKRERQKITPAPYPPGYDEDGNPIEVSDSTETEEIEEIETGEEVEEEKKKGSGSGSGSRGKGDDKKLKKKVRELEAEIAKLKKEKGRITPKDKEVSRSAPKDGMSAARGGKRVNTPSTTFSKAYGTGSNNDVFSSARGGSH